MLLKSKRNGISAQSLMICSRSVNDWIPKKLKPDDSPADRFYIVNQFEVIRFSQRRFICSRKSYEVPITMPASAKGSRTSSDLLLGCLRLTVYFSLSPPSDRLPRWRGRWSRGADFPIVWTEILATFVIGSVYFGVALYRFRRVIFSA